MAAPTIIVERNDSEVADKLCLFVIEKANESIQARNIFLVGLSGGSLVKFLCGGLPALKTDWSKWRIFFCDERHVPYTDPECTYSQYKKNLVDVVGMSPDHIMPIDANLSVEDAAVSYAANIQTYFPEPGLPRFDLLLLGMGPDGHTCSLFPGHPLLDNEKEKEKIVAPISDSPKPPPCRVTLTFPVINNARCAVFASCGAGKADIVQRVLESDDVTPLPAARVRPTAGQLVWFLDTAAAARLKKKL